MSSSSNIALGFTFQSIDVKRICAVFQLLLGFPEVQPCSNRAWGFPWHLWGFLGMSHTGIDPVGDVGAAESQGESSLSFPKLLQGKQKGKN